MVRRLAMSRPDVAFTLAGEERAPVTWAAALPGAPGRLARLADILGAEFRANAVEVQGERDGVTVEGFAALPTHTRANALGQYLFVNGRPVRDKLLIGVVRGAYADYLPRDRHPIVALFVTLDPREVDVNVHPAKAEVRFRDPALVRALLITSLQRGAGARRPARRDDRRQRHHRGVPAGDAAPRGGWDWRRSPALPDPRGFPMPARGNARGRDLRKRRRPRSRSAVRPPTRASRSRSPRPTCSTGRSAPRARRCTRPTSWRRPATASSSSTSTPRTSASSTSA